MKYTAQQIKRWHVPGRPSGLYWRMTDQRPKVRWQFFARLKAAWLVFIGRYDALDWEDKQ